MERKRKRACSITCVQMKERREEELEDTLGKQKRKRKGAFSSF
jgi:hypothetical protein